MSNGIMEKNLPVATELGEGDMVRIVTGGGNSKSIDKDAFGSGIVFVTMTFVDENTFSCDKSFSELETLLNDGVPVLAIWVMNPPGLPMIPGSGSALLHRMSSSIYLICNENNKFYCNQGNNFVRYN